MTPRSRGARTALIVGGGAGVAAAAVTAVLVRGVRSVPGIPLDARWAKFVDAHQQPVVVGASQVLALLGGAPGSIGVAAAIGGLLWWRRGARSALGFVVAAAVDEALVTALKFFDQRPGPSGALFEDRGSFPSGHTAFAAVVAVVLAATTRRPVLRVAALALIPVMAVSRTVVDAHWLTDTLAGGVCGAGVAAIAVGLLAPSTDGVPGR